MVKAEVFGPGTYDSCANKVKKLTGVLLIFHPGCSHCVQMRPEWEAMKRDLSPNTRVVEIDGSQMAEHPAMKKVRFASKIEGFPTLLRMKEGEPADIYRGQRTSGEMKQFFESGNEMGMKKSRKSRKRRKNTKRKKMRAKTLKRR
jgi:hypothetical protein